MADEALGEERYFRSADGTRLFCRRVPASGEAVGRLAILHGYAEHCDRYRFVTDYFSAAGFDCWTMDFRGHGRSEGRRGFIKRFAEYYDDIEGLLALMKTEGGGEPLFLVAHSNGGLATTRWLQERPERAASFAPVGLVLSSPFFALKLKVAGLQRGLATALSGVMPNFSLPNELKAEDLTRDASVQEAWERDEAMVRKVPARWFTEALKAQDALFPAASLLRLPLTLHHGAADPVADPRASERFFEVVGSEDKSLKLWPEYRHEIFNELGREAVFAEVEAWIRERLPGS